MKDREAQSERGANGSVGRTDVVAGSKPLSATQLIEDLMILSAERDRVAIRDVVDRLGTSGFPVLVLVLVLPALIPIPGPYGALFGLAVAILAMQMIVGRAKPWLPAFVLRRTISAHILLKAGEKAHAWVDSIETLHEPGRLSQLTGPHVTRIAGVIILPLAIMIGLPIPFGNLPPVIAIGMIAFALMLRDGAALILALAAAILAALWVAAVFWFGAEVLARLIVALA